MVSIAVALLKTYFCSSIYCTYFREKRKKIDFIEMESIENGAYGVARET